MIVVLIASGKGGTGKTTITAMLAIALRKYYNIRVALLDLDTCGPNLPRVLQMQTGNEQKGKTFDENLFYPKSDGDFEIFSPSFLIPDDVAISWDGVKRQNLIMELMLKVVWNKPDILLCDCPPGTGDEIVAVLTYAKKIDGVYVITTGARASVDDAKRLVAMMRSDRFNTPVLGIVENMGYTIHNKKPVRVFSDGIDLTEELGTRVIATIPFRNKMQIEDYRPIADNLINTIGKGLLVVEKPKETQVPDHKKGEEL